MGLTFDTGVLIGLERRDKKTSTLFRVAMERGVAITVPSPVVAEWWRGRTDANEDILAGVDVEPLSDAVARSAGAALAAVKAKRCDKCSSTLPSIVDAVVMASASLRGDVVYTADFDDLASLQPFFRSVTKICVV